MDLIYNVVLISVVWQNGSAMHTHIFSFLIKIFLFKLEGLPWSPSSVFPMQVGLGSIPGQGTNFHMLQLRRRTTK